jgi:hypothetical protein
MTTPESRRSEDQIDFEGAAALLEQLLRGPARAEIVDRVLTARDFGEAVKRLRAAMRAHGFKTPSGAVVLEPLVSTLDAAGRKEGFHVLREWEQAAGRMSREEIPVLMVDHFSQSDAATQGDRRALAILLDFYFLYVLALLLMRAWDQGDPNQNLDRVTALLGDLQGEAGSGQRFADDAGTLLFIATSNFQPDERGYHRLLQKVWGLDDRHRVVVAMSGAPVVGTHLRWAFSAIYERDLTYMRKDNAIDYPWLFFSVATLMREYARLREAGVGPDGRRAVVAALLNGLSPDPWAFVGKPPEPLAGYPEEHAEFRRLFALCRRDLLDELEAQMPSKDAYSPLSLQFNFPHNMLVALVVIALLGGDAPNVPLNALLTAPPDRASGDDVALLARAMTGYAAAHPERRGERRILPVAYNESVGLRSFSWTMSALRKDADTPPPAP